MPDYRKIHAKATSPAGVIPACGVPGDQCWWLFTDEASPVDCEGCLRTIDAGRGPVSSEALMTEDEVRERFGITAPCCESCHEDMAAGFPGSVIELDGREVPVCCAVSRAFGAPIEASPMNEPIDDRRMELRTRVALRILARNKLADDDPWIWGYASALQDVVKASEGDPRVIADWDYAFQEAKASEPGGNPAH
jgi:hypothetical protein